MHLIIPYECELLNIFAYMTPTNEYIPHFNTERQCMKQNYVEKCETNVIIAIQKKT